MKRLFLFSAILVLLTGCSSKKQIQQQLDSGNYDQAVTNALRQLQSRKTSKRKSKFISILKNGYDKVTNRDLEDISFFKKDNNPQNYVRIFELYNNLDARQRAIEPVLPLYLDGREITFKFNDYTSEMIVYKNKASKQLYVDVLNLLKSNNKYDIRKAYDDLAYINSINPNYKDIAQLMEEAHSKGTHHVIVDIENQTDQVIPTRLEDDLLNFDTYGLNDFWTVYHGNQINNLKYDFAMQLQLRRINISPERVSEREILRKKDIVDGWEYVLDANGNVVKDSLGNDVKQDKIITAKARLFEISQVKSTQVIANVIYSDLQTNQIMESFPIDSEFIFENIYADYNGDKRALTKQDKALLRNRPVGFPSNEQMVYDTGEDLKLKLKEIITRYNFRS